MISYREKQLLAVLKYMQDQSADLAGNLSDALDATAEGKRISVDCTSTTPVETFEELCARAEAAGYDTYIRAEDILSVEELEDIERRRYDIEKQFRELTKLHVGDYGFLVIAITLQIIRQAIQPSLDFENLDPYNREGHDMAAQKTDKSKAEKWNEKVMTDAKSRDADITFSDDYYAPLCDIANISKGVPYDETAIKGLGGKMHRFKTLGHDPVLGYLFGTCNILTNTLTTSDLTTIHIRRNGRALTTATANTGVMFMYSKARYKEEGGKFVVAAAIAKQAYHIHSDQKSKEGIGLPFLQRLCDEKTIRALCMQGIDYNALEFLGTIAKQSGYAELINFIIAITHRIYIAKEEYENYCRAHNLTDEGSIRAVLSQKSLHDLLWGNEEHTEVRTRKIILISNAVASCANIVYVGIIGGVSAYTGNSAGIYDALGKLDVGGIIITIMHLLTDTRIISKIKDDFIKSTIMDEFQLKMNEIQKATL